MKKISNLGMTYRVRMNGRKVPIFQKTNEIKKQLKQILPEVEGDKLICIFSHCRSFYEGNLYYGRRTTNPKEKAKRKRIKLTETEKIVYDFMLKNNLNPSTTYRWFLACRLPSDIKEKLATNKMSYKQAMQISYNRRRNLETNTGMMMMEEMRNVMRGL